MAKTSLVNLDGLGYTGLPLPTFPSDAASKEYVDNQVSTITPNPIPFWDSTNTLDCIALSNGVLPFWDSNNTPSNITLGCV
jgi:hypothetical protein